VIDFSYEIICILLSSHYLYFPFCVVAPYVFYLFTWNTLMCLYSIEHSYAYFQPLSTCVIEFSYQWISFHRHQYFSPLCWTSVCVRNVLSWNISFNYIFASSLHGHMYGLYRGTYHACIPWLRFFFFLNNDTNEQFISICGNALGIFHSNISNSN
jgi:hypothetical protein